MTGPLASQTAVVSRRAVVMCRGNAFPFRVARSRVMLCSAASERLSPRTDAELMLTSVESRRDAGSTHHENQAQREATAPRSQTGGAPPAGPPIAAVGFAIEFPGDEPPPMVETSLMVRTVRRTMAVVPGGGLVVWTGPSRAGKTMTARWFAQKLEDACATDARGFRAVHFEAAITPTGNDGMKRGVQALYSAAIAPMSETVYRQRQTESMATILVDGLRARNVRVVLVDEAGLMSTDALNGLVLVRDVAENEGWPVTVVLIGMDDLPTKLAKRPQVASRIHEWCFFQPYSLEETHELLAALHPHFAELDLRITAHRSQVDFLHRTYGGLPGLLVPYLRRLTYRERELGVPISLDVLRAVHLLTERDRHAAVDAAAKGFSTNEGTPARTVPRSRKARTVKANPPLDQTKE